MLASTPTMRKHRVADPDLRAERIVAAEQRLRELDAEHRDPPALLLVAAVEPAAGGDRRSCTLAYDGVTP